MTRNMSHHTTKDLFDVFLTGRLLDGHNRREVIVNLAQLTGSSLPQATALLDGAVRMKASVDQATAGMYHEVLEETGAEAVVQACVRFSTLVAEVVLPVELEDTLPPLQEEATLTFEDAPVEVEEPAAWITPELTPPFSAPSYPHHIEPTSNVELPVPPVDITEPFYEPPPAFPRRRNRMALVLVAAGLAGALLVAALGFWPWGQATVTQQVAVGEVLNLAQPYQQKVDSFWQQQGRPPLNLAELGLDVPPALGERASLTLGAEGRLLIIFSAGSGAIAGATLELIPRPANAGIEWQCGGGTLPVAARPAECR